jgi:hypothetical protein
MSCEDSRYKRKRGGARKEMGYQRMRQMQLGSHGNKLHNKKWLLPGARRLSDIQAYLHHI